jgi:hypothetical protein
MTYLNGQAKMKNILYFFLLCASSMVSANECRMTIHAKNDTGSTVAAGLFNQKDEKIAVMSIGGKEEVVFKDLCASQYKVIFKDGSKYTESQILNITYTVTVTGNSTSTSWENGTVQYFVTKGRSSGKAAADKYHF